jgi:hypothetical protein
MNQLRTASTNTDRLPSLMENWLATAVMNRLSVPRQPSDRLVESRSQCQSKSTTRDFLDLQAPGRQIFQVFVRKSVRTVKYRSPSPYFIALLVENTCQFSSTLSSSIRLCHKLEVNPIQLRVTGTDSMRLC